MTLGDIIRRLEREDPARPVRFGLGPPCSYRGNYDELAFVYSEDTNVANMLSHACYALGSSFLGYKGGTYLMTEDTPCHLVRHSSEYHSEDEITSLVLSLMLGTTLVFE